MRLMQRKGEIKREKRWNKVETGVVTGNRVENSLQRLSRRFRQQTDRRAGEQK